MSVSVCVTQIHVIFHEIIHTQHPHEIIIGIIVVIKKNRNETKNRFRNGTCEMVVGPGVCVCVSQVYLLRRDVL